MPINIPRNPSFYSFDLFLIVALTPFFNKPDSSSDLAIFMISFIASLEIINFVVPDPNIFLWIAASVADAAAVNHNGIKMLLANVLSTFFIKGKQKFSNGPESLPKNPPSCPILCNWVFDNFTLAEELFAKALRWFETCVLDNNSLCGKLLLSLESQTTFDENFKVILITFFIPNYKLLSC